MWNKSISLPVKKMDPTINDNGITMEETYKFIGGIPADFRDSTRDDEVLAKQNGYTNIEHFTDDGYSGGSFDRLWRVIILENHSWWMNLQVIFMT